MLRSLSLLVVSTCFAASAAIAQEGPMLVRAPVQKVFVPFGFDDNDNVEVVIYGHFPSTCYKTGPATASVDYTTNTVTIDAQSYRYSGTCGQLEVPFVQSIKLGTVQQGSFKIVVKGTDSADTSVPLTVGKALSTNPDDFLYAPAASASLVKDSAGNDVVRLEGTWPYTFVGCMTMREVRTEVTAGNVVVIRPVAQLISRDNDPACSSQQQTHKFQIDTRLAHNLTAGDYLLHVRVLNGNSVNEVETLVGGAD